MAKSNKKVFETAVPQLQQVYQNSILLRDTLSGKVQSEKTTLANMKVTLPMMPVALQKDKSDYVNRVTRPTKQKNEAME